MRLVADTNIFVSAALKHASWPAETLRWIDAHGGLLKSDATEEEVIRVLARPRFAPKITPLFQATMRRLLAEAEHVTITQVITACRDPKDDKFLELAINGSAEIIISGDADLLVLNPFRGIPIVTAAAFIASRPA